MNFATDLARWRSKTAREGELLLKVDFFPTTEAKALDRALDDRFAANSGKKLKNSLGGLLPPRVLPRVLAQSGADPEKALAQVTKAERDGLVAALKGFRLTFRKLMDESRAVVSSGGLHTSEVDWRTMACKKVPNLLIGGDLLDINRPSGGYSLQLCWATGWVAGSANVARVPTPGVDSISR